MCQLLFAIHFCAANGSARKRKGMGEGGTGFKRERPLRNHTLHCIPQTKPATPPVSFTHGHFPGVPSCNVSEPFLDEPQKFLSGYNFWCHCCNLLLLAFWMSTRHYQRDVRVSQSFLDPRALETIDNLLKFGWFSLYFYLFLSLSLSFSNMIADKNISQLFVCFYQNRIVQTMVNFIFSFLSLFHDPASHFILTIWAIYLFVCLNRSFW